jgi:hypothetical protein
MYGGFGKKSLGSLVEYLLDAFGGLKKMLCR